MTRKKQDRFNTPNNRKAVQLSGFEPTRTKQSFKDECDINQIVAKYQETGAVSHANYYEPFYGDIDPCTYQEALDQINLANEMFEDLPSSLRDEFQDTTGMLRFFANATPEQLAERDLISGDLGLEDTIPAGMIVEEPENLPSGSQSASEGAEAT